MTFNDGKIPPIVFSFRVEYFDVMNSKSNQENTVSL